MQTVSQRYVLIKQSGPVCHVRFVFGACMRTGWESPPRERKTPPDPGYPENKQKRVPHRAHVSLPNRRAPRSPHPLVSAPPWPQSPLQTSHPFSRSYETNLPNSQSCLLPIGQRLLISGTCCGLPYAHVEHRCVLHTLFMGYTESCGTHTLDATHGSLLKGPDSCARTSSRHNGCSDDALSFWDYKY